MNKELLPCDCPFCGTIGVIKIAYTNHLVPRSECGFYARCGGESCIRFSVIFKTKEEAINAWNHRASAPGMEPVMGEMEFYEFLGESDLTSDRGRKKFYQDILTKFSVPAPGLALDDWGKLAYFIFQECVGMGITIEGANYIAKRIYAKFPATPSVAVDEEELKKLFEPLSIYGTSEIFDVAIWPVMKNNKEAAMDIIQQIVNKTINGCINKIRAKFHAARPAGVTEEEIKSVIDQYLEICGIMPALLRPLKTDVLAKAVLERINKI